MPDVKISQLAAASAASVAAGAGLWTMAGHILGLRMEYVGPTALRVSTGSAWIPSLQRAVEVTSALTLNGLSLTANTWYHVFLWMNGAVPAIEAVTAAPAAPYSGTARAKTADLSRRYIGSILTDGAAAICRFVHAEGEIQYLVNALPPFRVLAGGSATTRTAVSLSGVIPSTATVVHLNAINNGDQQLFLDVPEIGNSGAASRYTCLANQRTPIITAAPSLALQYFYTVAPVGSGAFLDVWGYRYDR